MNNLVSISLILIFTTLIGNFFKRIGLPIVVGELCVGVALGPGILGWIEPNQFIKTFSEFGVVLLMFLAGLGSDLKGLKKFFKPSITIAFSGTIFPLIMTYFVARAFRFNFSQAAFLGVIFSATSVSITVEILREMNLLASNEGITILGSSVADDIISVFVLSLLISFTGSQSNENAMNIVYKILGLVAYFVFAFVVIHWLINYIMFYTKKLFSPMSETVVSIVLCFSMASLSELCGLSDVIGAFFAGLAISTTDSKSEIVKNINPIGYAVFIPFFFVSIGLNVSFEGFTNDFLLILSLTVIGILSKIIGAGFASKFCGFDYPHSYLIGSGMVARGEMALIVAQIGFSANLLTADRYTAVIMAIILVTLSAPFLVKHAAGRLTKQAS
ncbi:cation:proton antiporter [Oenococcus oeni]|uniref:cation:proton antiporter n=1 Tax=Oenococcus oeni TaxID=1247 RepID=UPI0008F8CDB7|nr:cation:proton antiporter [Oenococcus oeni]MDV7687522.1 sodium:proton antiporter [Oenococcus oeni]OIM25805.1 sodium:proton antiporter [Oenococcus oeni]